VEDCVIDGRITLKSVLNQYGIRMLIGFLWFRTDNSDEVLWSRSWILKFRKSCGISRVSQWLPASQEDSVLWSYSSILFHTHPKQSPLLQCILTSESRSHEL